MTMAVEDPGPQIREFDTFEGREAAFNEAVQHIIPARYMGPQRFWEEFQRITDSRHGIVGRLPAYITGNPKDCLAFGTVGQVVAAARWSGSDSPSSFENSDLLEAFGLQGMANQPLRTLSGGETVRLALAKALAAAAHSERLVVSSPFCWLSRNHRPLLDRVLKSYRDAGKPVEMLMMRGESNQDEISSQRLQGIVFQPMDFVLRLTKLQIHLGTPINAITARPARAGVADFSDRLTSPCLMVGDNGQGKSLVAKALCHAVGYDGDAQVGDSRDTGYGRLLFQDVVTQTLLRSFPELGRSGRPDADAAVTAIYRELVDLQGLSAEDVDGLGNTGPQSLLAVKTMLIAVRLARQPAALILDEPDWGLSRAAAVDLVLSVLQAAHRREVPVILISHKPWWRPVAGSMVRVVKAVSASAETVFDIELQKAAGTAVDDGIW